MKPTDEQLEDLARIATATTDQELDCAEMVSHVGAYLGALTNCAEIDAHLQQVVQHLDICTECKEEFVTLLLAEGIDPQINADECR
ncbi:MAG: hypothetical protein ACYTHJ_04230 [Planctomycetota bacterium]|jgi:hypothetical protein